MSYNSRRPRQSKLATPAEVTRLADAAIATADVCPACGLAMPFVGGKHGQTCKKLRVMVRDADSALAHHLARAY